MKTCNTTPKLPRPCSLKRHLRIERADNAAPWRALAQYHYRHHSAGAIDKVFVIRRQSPESKNSYHKLLFPDLHQMPVGVIVYGMPLINIAWRNRATNNRYLAVGNKQTTLRLINQEIRAINRVVIHPQYRGIGLAHWLVRQTLPLAGTPLVEALAAMGRVNPFFAKAGMTRYDGPPSPKAARLLAAFAHVGITESQIYDPQTLQHAIQQLNPADYRLLTREISSFAHAFGRFGRKLAQNFQQTLDNRPDENYQTNPFDPQTSPIIELVVTHLCCHPVYYLWRRP